jgi:hypothetical protein
MALDIYIKGTDVVTSKSPVDAPAIYSIEDLERIESIQADLKEGDLQIAQEYHIYSGENLLKSNDKSLRYEINTKADSNNNQPYDILLTPEKDVRQSNISKGNFSVVYNFLDKQTDKLKIEEISADASELQLVIDSEKDGTVDSYEGLKAIENLYSDGLGLPELRDGNTEHIQYVLNFGNNDLAAITQFDFSLNEREGYQLEEVDFPTDKYQGIRTRFYPMQNLDGYWCEVYIDDEVITEVEGAVIEEEVEDSNQTPSIVSVDNPLKPTDDSDLGKALQTDAGKAIMDAALGRTSKTSTKSVAGSSKANVTNTEVTSKTSKIIKNPQVKDPSIVSDGAILNKGADKRVSFKDNLNDRLLVSISPQKVSKKFRTTGRGSKFVLEFNDNEELKWIPVLDKLEEQYFEFGNDDKGFPIRPNSDYTKLLRGAPISSEVQYNNPNFKNTGTEEEPDVRLNTVTVKLYKPLRGDLQNKTPRIEKVVRESYIEKLLVYPTSKKLVEDNFSEPNFKIDMGTYGKSVGTDLRSWNDLLDTNLSTSQQIVDKYISSSFENNINVNYSDFSEFVHYSSAVERVNNFKYKVELIEGYESRIKTLESVSGTEALTNISQSITRKNTVVSGMDGWERWMYNEASSSLYTHYSSSAFTISPWPKYSAQPVNLYSVTSSLAISHYNGLIDSASYFDSMNDARLTKTIPASISEDTLNADYLLFIDMIGHHFDITWAYVKKLTSINSREEHPFDGMPNNLLYDVAKSMGWKLSHGKDREELWSYALGTDKYGNPQQSGSLAAKPVEQYTQEIWRRIVNNIPYLLKSKGSARAVKALISTYGIPQTFLSIREYGGPVIEDKRQFWEHERFVYHLRFDTDNYMEVPFDKVNDIDPNTYLNRDPNPIDTIELQVQQNKNRTTAVLNKDKNFGVLYESLSTATTGKKGNIHFYLSGSSGYKSASINNISLFDSKMGTLIVQREKSVDDITQDNEYKLIYRRSRRDNIIVDKSASIFITGSTEPSYNAAWTGSGTLTVGKSFPTDNTPSLWGNTEYLSGSIQELRYWANPLKDIVIDEHTLARESYHGNSETSSYFDLKFRFLADSRLKNVDVSDSQPSQHPNQKISTLLNGQILSASLHNFESDDLRGVTEEYHTKVPSAGANNIMNNKIRVEPNRLRGMLDVDERKETSKFDSAPNDSNVLGVYLSATKMYNEDIYNHTGYFDIDDYIGDPDGREGFTEQNEQLDYLRRQVFKKYSTKNLINSTIDILARYDFSVFEQIRQTVPARVDYNSGILIEPHILERPKVKSKVKVVKTEPMYEVTINPIDKVPQMFITPLSASLYGSPNVTDWTVPTYNTTISGTASPDILMDYPTYDTTVSGTVSPKFIMTYPTYDNFKSKNIPQATASFESEYLTYGLRLDLNTIKESAEYLTHETLINLNENVTSSAEYLTHNTEIPLTQSLLQSAEYVTHKTSIVVDTERSMSGTYQLQDQQNIWSTPKDLNGNFYLLNTSFRVTQSIFVERSDLEERGLIRAKLPYKPSSYKFDILIPKEGGDVGYGVGWITGSNGSWNYNPLGTSIINQRNAQYARTTNYFYSSSVSASMGLSYSSSLSPSQVSTDNLPLAVENLRYLGCKMSSDSLTTNSTQTPDGKPVIEIFEADPNVLINTSQTAEDGNLDVDTNTGIATINVDDLKISEEIRYQRELEYRAEVQKFRREIARIQQIENSRRAEFDLRLQNSEDISNRESARQDEFDVVNDPIVVKKEIEEREVREEEKFIQPEEVRFLDGQPINVERNEEIEKEQTSELIQKLNELPMEERESFIEEEEIDKRVLRRLEIPVSKKQNEKQTRRTKRRRD